MLNGPRRRLFPSSSPLCAQGQGGGSVRVRKVLPPKPFRSIANHNGARPPSAPFPPHILEAFAPRPGELLPDLLAGLWRGSLLTHQPDRPEVRRKRGLDEVRVGEREVALHAPGRAP